jgi:glycine cleavage system aminomethyltransferase T
LASFEMLSALHRHSRYDIRGTGRWSVRPSGASIDLFVAAVEAAWAAIDSRGVVLQGTWPDDEELEAQLTAAGWTTARPRRTRVGPLTVSRGDLRADAVAHVTSELKSMLTAADEASAGVLELALDLRGSGAGATAVRLVLTEPSDTVEIRAEGPDSERVMNTVKASIERIGPELGLQVQQRRQ